MTKVAQAKKPTTAPVPAAEPASKRKARKRADGEGTLSFDKKSRLWRGSLMVGMKTVTTEDGKLIQRHDRRKVAARTQELCRQRLDALKHQRDGQQLVATPRLTV